MFFVTTLNTLQEVQEFRILFEVNPGFPTRETGNSWEEGKNLSFDKIWKMKEIEPRGEAPVPSAPLYPPV